jgi:hypothetical protein
LIHANSKFTKPILIETASPPKNRGCSKKF